VSDGVRFPDGSEEWVYSGVLFSRSGDRQVFEKLAALSRDDPMRATLVQMLGAALEPTFGNAYRHLVVEEDMTSGKTTWLGEACRPKLARATPPMRYGRGLRSSPATYGWDMSSEP
jgi:hypothetical protein